MRPSWYFRTGNSLEFYSDFRRLGSWWYSRLIGVDSGWRWNMGGNSGWMNNEDLRKLRKRSEQCMPIREYWVEEVLGKNLEFVKHMKDTCLWSGTETAMSGIVGTKITLNRGCKNILRQLRITNYYLVKRKSVAGGLRESHAFNQFREMLMNKCATTMPSPFNYLICLHLVCFYGKDIKRWQSLGKHSHEAGRNVW